MGDSRRKIDGALKAKIALEAFKGERTYAELGALFSGKAAQVAKSNDELSDELYKLIGQLKVELDWLKKKSALLR